MKRLFVSLFFLPFITFAQVTLVKDIYPGFNDGAGSYPDEFVVYKGQTFVVLTDGSAGRELWKSDGTVEGTVILKDIAAGVLSSNPSKFVEIDDILYFVANDQVHGPELWRTDGTEAGTNLVKDINPGLEGSYISWITKAGTSIFLMAYDPAHGVELWKSDGTSAGTVFVKDIYPGKANSGSYAFGEFNGALYFNADDGVHGSELWRSDGTEAGTILFQDFALGITDSSPSEFEVLGGKLYISVYSSGIWSTDGTVAGTTLYQSSFYEGTLYEFTDLTAATGNLYFHAHTKDLTCKLLKTDGITAPVLVEDFYFGVFGGRMLQGIDVLDGNLVYSYADFSTTDSGATYEVEVTLKYVNPVSGALIFDGTSSDVINGSADLYELGYYSQLFKGPANTYYWGIVSSTNTTFYKKDGANPFTVFNAVTAQAPYIYANDIIFIGADLQDYKGRELYRSNGVLQPWTRLFDATSNLDSQPSNFAELGDVSIFGAYNGTEAGYSLWRSDGTEAGTALVKGADFSLTSQPVVIDGIAVFTASTENEGNELWVSTDGTVAGTHLLKDFVTGPDGSEPSNFAIVNDKLLFTVGDETLGFSLWTTDGTLAGTVAVTDLKPGSTDIFGNLTILAQSNSILYFEWDDGVQGLGIWKTDGTTLGTQFVKAVTLQQHEAAVLDDVLYFNGYTPGTGEELWRSDGTGAGTFILKEINAGPTYSPVRDFVAYHDKVLFTLSGMQLWMTDGTAAGTQIVRDFTPTVVDGYYEPAFLDFLTPFNDKIYFFNYRQLWVTDGTLQGTQKITTANDNTPFSSVSDVKVAGDYLFFIHNGIDNSFYMWVSDGTALHTERLPGLNFGYLSVGTLNESFLFQGGGAGGYELWKFTPKKDQEITFDPLEDVNYGVEPFEPGASSSSGLDISYSSSNTAVAIIVDGKITIVGAGEVIITASQDGDGEYWAAASVSQQLIVNKGDQEITLPDFTLKTFGNPPFSAGATSTSGLPVVVSSSNDQIASVNDQVITIHKAGVVVINANQAGNANYNAASSVSKTLTIQKANQTITFQDIPLKRSIDDPFEVPATVDSSLPLSFTSDKPEVATVENNTITIHGAGNATITASQAGDGNYNPAQSVSKVLTVELVTGIENALEEFNVHPNPTKGIVQIETAQPIKQVQVVDLMGKVHDVGLKENQLDLTGFAQGIYLLKIKTESKLKQVRISKE